MTGSRAPAQRQVHRTCGQDLRRTAAKVCVPKTHPATALDLPEPLPMQCPACPTVTLAMTERQGIEIDYCPSCRGVWLDRGELDRLIALSAPAPAAMPTVPSHDRSARQYPKHDSGYRHRKPKSLLGELFDF